MKPMTSVMTWMRSAALLGAIMASLTFALADVEVRTYDNSESVAPGQVKFRKAEVGEPSPYVNTAPLAISIVPMLEAPSETWDVVVLRLNLFVGNHRAVYGLDLGVLGNFADYKMNGLGIGGLFNSVGESDSALHIAGIFNFAAFDFNGCQISGVCSITEGTHCGVQIGLGNYAGNLVGVQIGGFNSIEKGTGVQIGLFNSADCLAGLQLGLININHSSSVSCLPILNFAF